MALPGAKGRKKTVLNTCTLFGGGREGGGKREQAGFKESSGTQEPYHTRWFSKEFRCVSLTNQKKISSTFLQIRQHRTPELKRPSRWAMSLSLPWPAEPNLSPLYSTPPIQNTPTLEPVSRIHTSPSRQNFNLLQETYDGGFWGCSQLHPNRTSEK